MQKMLSTTNRFSRQQLFIRLTNSSTKRKRKRMRVSKSKFQKNK